MFPIDEFREQFPLISTPPYQPFVYADSAATTQKPQVLIDKMGQFYSQHVANVHRGAYRLSESASSLYEQSRQYIKELFKVDECIFLRGATEGLNFLASSLAHNLNSGDHILLSIAEHHANIVCWQQLALKKNLTIHYAPIDEAGVIDIEYCRALFTQYPIKIVSMVHVSNTLGTLQPLAEIFSLAKKVGAMTIADCCQSLPVYIDKLHTLSADFIVFSGHKIFAPSGIGCLLIQQKQSIEKMQPYQTGGGMISHVTTSHSSFAPAPAGFEAGTPFIEGAHLLKVALEFVNQYDKKQVKSHLEELRDAAIESLSKVRGLKTFFIENTNRSPIFSVTFDDIHSHDLATFLDANGVCARAGHHCTMPLVRELGVSSLLRLSFGLYNTKEEVIRCAEVLQKAREFFDGR